MRVAIFVALVVVLTGCVTDRMNNGLGFMVGQNIQVAVARLGYPDAKREMLGDTIYVWGTSQDVNLPMTTSNNVYGAVGTTPFYGTATGTTWVRQNWNCTIQLAVGPDDIIKTWQWSGNYGGCYRYARALSH